MDSVIRRLTYIKLAAIEAFVSERVRRLRDSELTANFEFLVCRQIVCVFGNTYGALFGVVTLATSWIACHLSNQPIDVATVFSIFAFASSLDWPVSSALQILSASVECTTSIQRLTTFLSARDRSDDSIRPPRTIGLHDVSVVIGDKPILRSCTLRVDDGQLTMLIGSVGSGKTTALLAMLGEIDVASGIVDRALRTAYMSQDPWLARSRSIRDNVCLSEPVDEAAYDRAITATCLVDDLNSWPEGDRRLAQGLSGGQSQRIALARVVYAAQRCDLILLDDPLSAVDPVIEDRIWTNLFARDRGFLRDRRVVLVSSAVHHIVDADTVAFMQHGRIVEQGSPSQLLDRDGPTRALHDAFERKTQANRSDAAVGDRVKDSEASSAVDADAPDVESSQAVRGSSLLDVVRHSPLSLHLYWILSFASGAGPAILAGWLSWWLDRADYGAAGYLGGFVGISVAYMAGNGLAIVGTAVLGPHRLKRWIHADGLRSLLAASVSTLDSYTHGRLLSRFAQDVEKMDLEFSLKLSNVVSRFGSIVGRAVLIGIASPPLLGLMAASVAVVAVFQRFYVRTSRPVRKLELATKSALYTNYAETIDIHGLRTIRALGLESVCANRNAALAMRSQSPWVFDRMLESWWALATGMISTALVFSVALLAVGTRRSIGSATGGAALVAALGIGAIIVHLATSLVELQLYLTSLQRIRAIHQLPPERLSSSTQADKSTRDDTSDKDEKSLPAAEHAVEFSAVTFRYRPDHPPALSNVCLAIKPGERIGICGRTGSGKSSMLAILFALYDPQTGSIVVNGRSTVSGNKQALRDSMSIVPQEPGLLQASLRDNLDPSGLRSDAEIWSTLDSMSCADVVRRLPDKLDTEVDSSGSAFSRGERQLLALATCALRQRSIVALDESTASVDLETEAKIQQAMRDGFRDATVLIVAHRISTIMHCDRVVVMSKGEIVECGPPQELLKIENGHFRALAGL